MSPEVQALLERLTPAERERVLAHLARQREQRQRDQKASAGLPDTDWYGSHRTPTWTR